MFEIGDRVIYEGHDGVFLVRSVVQKDGEGANQYSIASVGQEDEVYMVDGNDLVSYDGTNSWESPTTAERKQAWTTYVAILPDMGQLIFIYTAKDNSYTVYRTEPGHIILDDDWMENSTVVRVGKANYDTLRQTFIAIANSYQADYKGEFVEELGKFLEEREPVFAYSDFRIGDRVSWHMGHGWVTGQVLGGEAGRNRDYVVKDDVGMVHIVQGSGLVFLDD